jgi:hypothetical protein
MCSMCVWLTFSSVGVEAVGGVESLIVVDYESMKILFSEWGCICSCARVAIEIALLCATRGKLS